MEQCPQKVSFLVPADTPTATYTITYQGMMVKNCNSIWCYSVSVSGSPGLSHWVLGVFETCQELLNERLISVERNGIKLEEDIGYELGTSDGVKGIKFEVGVEADESPVIYCITLRGVYETTSVDVAVKGGPTPAQRTEDAICGPSCEIRKSCQAITDLLESIALQEAGLAHIINAEGEKIQAALVMSNITASDLMTLNESVAAILRKVIKLEMVIEFKLEEISKIDCPICPDVGCKCE